MTLTIPTHVDLMDCLAETVFVEFDGEVAEHAVERAQRDVPGSMAEVWPERMRLAGKECGLRITPMTWTIREALAHVDRTLPVFTWRASADRSDGSGNGSAGEWVVLIARRGRKIRVANLADRQKDENISESRFVYLLGASSVREKRVFAIVQPLAPASGASVHGHVHEEHSHEDHSGQDRGAAHGGSAEPSPLRRLWSLLRPERRDMGSIAIFAVAIGLLSLATPIAIDALVTFVMFRGVMTPIVILAVSLFVCLTLSAIMTGLQVLTAEILQRRLFVRIASDLAHRLPHVRGNVFDRHYGPEMVNRFLEVVTVQKAVTGLILDGLGLVLTSAAGLVILAFYNPFLLGFDIVLIGCTAFIVFVLGRGAVGTSIAESRAKYAAQGWLEELARHPIAWKSTGGGDLAMVRMDALARTYLDARTGHFRIYFRQVVFLLGLGVAASSVMLGLGGWLVINDQLTLGQLVSSEFIVATILLSFAKMSKHIESYYDLMASMDKLGHLFDLGLERRDGEGRFAGDGPAAVKVTEAEFRHGASSHAVLHGVSFAIAPGERLAVVGPGGSGKSTLLELLFALKSAVGGVIEVDGMNLRDIRPETLRECAALVKGVEIVEGTIVDNIRMGRKEILLSEIRQALESVGLLDHVTQLPDGMQTSLFSTGAPLSQGHLRRIMLARALVGKPRLLLLDEALDNLDIDARQIILDTLFRPDAPWTIAAVTNNRDVMRMCDRAVVLNRGKLQRLDEVPREVLRSWNLD